MCLKKGEEALPEKFAWQLKFKSYCTFEKAWLDKVLCLGGEKSINLDIFKLNFWRPL